MKQQFEGEVFRQSLLYLHVGQAGNEVGSAFWRLAASEGPPAGRVFDEKGRCRAVFVDTEPKACGGRRQGPGVGQPTASRKSASGDPRSRRCHRHLSRAPAVHAR